MEYDLTRVISRDINIIIKNHIMIDLHTHILPNIDDGASSVEEALRMTDALYNQNIHEAVCTPHFDPTKITLEEFVNRRANALAQMKASKIHLIPASETVLHEYLFHYPDLSGLCIENTRYILIELPFQKKWNSQLYDTLSKFINYYNYIPIIAHIDRYPAVKKNRKIIKRLIDLGCVIQLNSSSIINKSTRKKAFFYLKKGYIDVLGSDCHNMQKRPPDLITAIEKVNEKLGTEYCKNIEYRAECIIKGIEFREKKSFLISFIS